MKQKLRAAALCLLVAVCLNCLSGCDISFASPADLYSLPQPADEYLQLQTLLAEEIAAGSEYAAPTDGSYRQPVQLNDLDGDGINEALAFFRDTDQTPKICIYSRFGAEDYSLAVTIQGEGTGIGSVEYADMDGDGTTDLLVAWQAGTDLQILNAYSLAGYNASVLLTADCSEYLVSSDLTGSGSAKLLALQFSPDIGGTVTMYWIDSVGEVHSSAAPLSTSLESIERLRTGQLSDGVTALFVEGSVYQDSALITDIFIDQAGQLVNITMGSDGDSRTIRSYAVYSRDINNDRVMEIPMAIPLPPELEEPSYWMLEWYAYDSTGASVKMLSTYHCYSDGWYLVLPEVLQNRLQVRRDTASSEERAVTLSALDPDTGELSDMLTIYTLTGDNRHSRAQLNGRFTLLTDDTTIYAAKILNDNLTQQEISQSFNRIYSEWNSGAL